MNNTKQTQAKEFSSRLFDEKSFYPAFSRDLEHCEDEVIIESPFITSGRMRYMFPIFEKLVKKGVKVTVMTRDPKLHKDEYSEQSEVEIQRFEALGVHVLVTTNHHHRKLAILDRKILWEGSLNILSQTKSREIMRRIDSKFHAQEMFDFLKLGRFI